MTYLDRDILFFRMRTPVMTRLDPDKYLLNIVDFVGIVQCNILVNLVSEYERKAVESVGIRYLCGNELKTRSTGSDVSALM